MVPKDNSSYVDCDQHDKQVAAVVCCHMVDATDPVGFIENSSDPGDLQAWCNKCEHFFLAEGDMTNAFVSFNDFAVVCGRTTRSCTPKNEKLPPRTTAKNCVSTDISGFLEETPHFLANIFRIRFCVIERGSSSPFLAASLDERSLEQRRGRPLGNAQWFWA